MIYVPIRFMEQQNNEPAPAAPSFLMPKLRHDGWTGEKIADFCEALAETAIVADACDAAGMGISGAYAARRRNPMFAAAWDAALGIARERLADTLLARSMEGNIEQLYRDGELVGERHVIDNRLGLAILRRLDRVAETGLSVSHIGRRAPEAPTPARRPLDWEMMIDALRTGDPDSVGKALALLKSNEVDEVEGPPNPYDAGDSDVPDSVHPEDHCWKDSEGVWMTHLAPPPGFSGYESTYYGADAYERECTAEEVELFDAFLAGVIENERVEDEAFRDAWLASLRESLASGEKFASG